MPNTVICEVCGSKAPESSYTQISTYKLDEKEKEELIKKSKEEEMKKIEELNRLEDEKKRLEEEKQK